MGFFFAFIFTFFPIIQEEGLQLELSQQETNEQICTSIHISSINEQILNIGTSSVYIEYNSDALSFKSYESKSFDKADLCEDYPFSAYGDHNHYSGHKGAVNITMTLRSQTLTCSDIDLTPSTIGTVCFDIIDATQPTGFKINERFTSFNKSGDSFETYKNVVFPEAANLSIMVEE